MLLGASGVVVNALAGERDRAGSASATAVPNRDVGLLDLSAVQAVKRMASGELTAERYAQALLARCADRQALNAFITLDPQCFFLTQKRGGAEDAEKGTERTILAIRNLYAFCFSASLR